MRVCACIYFCFVRSLPHSKMVSWKNALQKMPMTNIYMKEQSRSIFIPHKRLNEIEVIKMCRTAMPFNCMNFPMFIFWFFSLNYSCRTSICCKCMSFFSSLAQCVCCFPSFCQIQCAFQSVLCYTDFVLERWHFAQTDCISQYVNNLLAGNMLTSAQQR